MSIILKGIDLPNSGQIEIIIRPHGKVFSKTRGISAEAIQIPKGHGRLIDADALFEAMGLDTVKEVMLRNWKLTTAWGVPIIEAEEQDDI